MRKIEEVLRLHHECGRTNREIAQAVRASPTTVGDYLRRARLAGLVWPLVDGMTEAALEAALFPPLPAATVKRPEPIWAAVHREVGRAGVTLDLLWQEYRECHPDGYQYSGFCVSCWSSREADCRSAVSARPGEAKRARRLGSAQTAGAAPTRI